ncbi:hypothetical protein CEXT_55211 [Caerostris extrusa]|uniref:Uncharacterized protein n=1 Tax=Caerostris extrusa TaxID=172846 RepID=A0AAV4Q7W3_CAEEX|nr:hypothetical protein CEXT_55211 [Caerostris extrusa]
MTWRLVCRSSKSNFPYPEPVVINLVVRNHFTMTGENLYIASFDCLLRIVVITANQVDSPKKFSGKTGNAEDPEKREPLSPLVRIPVTSSTPASPSGRKEGERARPKVESGDVIQQVCLSTRDHRLESPTAAWKPSGKPLISTHSDSSDSTFDLELELAYIFAKTI